MDEAITFAKGREAITERSTCKSYPVPSRSKMPLCFGACQIHVPLSSGRLTIVKAFKKASRQRIRWVSVNKGNMEFSSTYLPCWYPSSTKRQREFQMRRSRLTFHKSVACKGLTRFSFVHMSDLIRYKPLIAKRDDRRDPLHHFSMLPRWHRSPGT